MKRKVRIVLLFGIIVFGIVYLLYGFPIILNKNQNEVLTVEDTLQTIFNPIENIDLSTGNNVAYLLIGRTDAKELPQGMSKSKIFECRDNEVLQRLQENFIFIKTGGDMATCESEIFIYNNEKLVLHSSFVLTKSVVGLQNSVIGWGEALNKEKLKDILLHFDPVNRPIVKL